MTRTSNIPLATVEYFSALSFGSDIPTTTPAPASASSSASSSASASASSSSSQATSNPRLSHDQGGAFEVPQTLTKDSGHMESGASFEIPIHPSKTSQLAPSEHEFAPAHFRESEDQHISPVIHKPDTPTMTAVEPRQPTSSPAPSNPLREQDTSGQVAPPAMKPSIKATFWADGNTVCWEVEVNNTIVTRRDDNHMKNGTQLLKAAGVDRVSRDIMLKSEEIQHFIEIGDTHMIGVWIPFERALDLANNHGITESLYPLFVFNIGKLLSNPGSQAQTPAIQTQQTVPLSYHSWALDELNSQYKRLRGAARMAS